MFSKEFHLKYYSVIDDMIVKYSEPHRFYHTLSHLSQMIELYNDLVDRTEIEYKDEDVLGILLHDAIYSPESNANEEDSAILVDEYLDDTVDTKYIKRFILATKTHSKTGNKDINLLLDIDMSILSSEKDVYKQYSEDIMREYHMYDFEKRRRGRVRFLSGLLKSGIYISEYFRLNYEHLAVENIKRELSHLER